MEKEYDILCVGCMVCDFLLKPVPKDFYNHDTYILDSMENNIGGDAANEAVIMAKLGNKVALVTEAGGDGTGRELMDYLNGFGIDTSHIAVREGMRTQTSVLAICDDGDRHALITPLSETGYGSRELDYSLLEKTKAVSIGSMMMYPELDKRLPDYLKRARELGVLTAGDMMVNHFDGWLENMKRILPHLDYFFPNEVEAELLTGESDPEKMAETLFEWGVKNVILKLGPDGCYIRNGDGSFSVPAFPAECIDTTGAGDNFVAAFLTAAVRGWDIRRCTDFASAAGAIAVSSMGTTTGIRDMEQVINLMKAHGRY
ncbi:carbohydrate kinase family protein [Anaerolentibacter hominis]|uniref:carbohydrate kinase family protein n=1 Tax=Anaerolentibacter hominis TaxID=3079009 RepID=UPI0031B882E5